MMHDMAHGVTRHAAWHDMTEHMMVSFGEGASFWGVMSPQKDAGVFLGQDVFLGCDVGGQKDAGVFLGRASFWGVTGVPCKT